MCELFFFFFYEMSIVFQFFILSTADPPLKLFGYFYLRLSSLLKKIVELAEILIVRHSCFIIGSPGSGKTTVWK